MTTVPITAVRQALDDTEAALARLRPALGAAYGIAGENLTRAAGQLDVAERARTAAEQRAEKAAKSLAAMEADRNRHQKYAVKASQRLAAADQRARLAADRAVKAERAAAHAAQVETGRAMWKSKAEQIELRLNAAEQVRSEAVRVADRATQTLLRIKHARTAADAWTELGTHYHLSPTEAGRRARDWRSAAERDATKRAETASVLGARYMGDAERFHAAWHSARLRAKQTASELRVTQASRRRWKRRAKSAEQALADIRTPQPISTGHPMYALLAAMIGPGIGQAEARQHLTDYFNAITGREQ